MSTLDLLGHGFLVALTPTNLLFVLIGVTLGQIIGALPGIGPSLGMVLLLPISFGLQPVTAIVMLSGIMYGAMYGGTLTSVLINVPGESSSVMTAAEGYPLARQGRGGAAFSVAAVGSFIAGTVEHRRSHLRSDRDFRVCAQLSAARILPARRARHLHEREHGWRLDHQGPGCRRLRPDCWRSSAPIRS